MHCTLVIWEVVRNAFLYLVGFFLLGVFFFFVYQFDFPRGPPYFSPTSKPFIPRKGGTERMLLQKEHECFSQPPPLLLLKREFLKCMERLKKKLSSHDFLLFPHTKSIASLREKLSNFQEILACKILQFRKEKNEKKKPITKGSYFFSPSYSSSFANLYREKEEEEATLYVLEKKLGERQRERETYRP